MIHKVWSGALVDVDYVCSTQWFLEKWKSEKSNPRLKKFQVNESIIQNNLKNKIGGSIWL